MTPQIRDATVPKPDYDDPKAEQRWCNEQRAIVADFLQAQKVEHRRIGEWPAWHVAPIASIWAIESLACPEAIGWWVICGDLPTDYVSSADVEPPQHPRKAMRAIAHRWLKMVDAWRNGRECEDTYIAGPHSHQELALLLESRAKLLSEWADDDTLWEHE
jgi:hypothetical protein